MNLKCKLISVFLSINLLLVVFVGFISYHSAKTSLETSIGNELTANAQKAVVAVQERLDQQLQNLLYIISLALKRIYLRDYH